MRRTFAHRLSIALVVVLSLLFSQLALAAYVCPGGKNPAAMAAMMAAGQPCSGMDDAKPALCHEHGAASPQSFEPFKVPAATLPAIVQVLDVPLVLDAGAALPAPRVRAAELRPPLDPLFLSTLRLRV
jgi:hypothetical protein